MNTPELEAYVNALRDIIKACERPFGKDARLAKRIAQTVLDQWGKK